MAKTVTCEIRVYQDGTSIPTNPTATLSKVIPSASLTTVNFNISPLIREHIKHISFTETTSVTTMDNTEWRKVQVITRKPFGGLPSVVSQILYYDAVDGFTYRPEGYNVLKTSGYCMLEDGKYFTKEDSCGSLYFDTTDDSEDYLFEWRHIKTNALLSSLTTGAGGKLKIPYVLPSSFAIGGNVLTIANDSDPDDILCTFNFVTECSGKYTPIDCDFVNRFGAWQRITFFKASRLSMQAGGKDYNLMSANLDYDTSVGSYQSLNINGRESIKVNTGLVGENYASAIRELLLSETILLDGQPVNVKTKGVDLPTHENVKQINYSIEFQYAYDMINTLGI